MKYMFTYLFFCFISHFSSSQSLWQEGEVFFRDGKRVITLIHFNTAVEEGLLQVRVGNHMETYSPVQVEAFRFFDQEEEKDKTFYSVPIFIEKKNYYKNMFLEVIFEGDQLCLLAKKITTSIKGLDVNQKTYTRKTRPKDYESLVILDLSTSKIKPYTSYTRLKYPIDEYLNPNRRLLFQLMQDKKQEVKNYIRKNDLAYHKKGDMVQVFKFYHELK